MYTLAARHCPDSDETLRGHMVQPRQHIRSTKPTDTPTSITAAGQPPTPTIDIQVIPINHIFTDDTGRFTPQACRGNQYIMVALHSESNAILVRPFQLKHDSHCIGAYNDLYNRLVAQHATPDVHILDNEASKAFLLTDASISSCRHTCTDATARNVPSGHSRTTS